MSIPPDLLEDIQWRRCPAGVLPSEPGGGMEYQFHLGQSGVWQALAVLEVFETVPEGDRAQAGQAGWPFYFEPVESAR